MTSEKSLDLAELKSLRAQSSRPSVQSFLDAKIQSLGIEVEKAHPVEVKVEPTKDKATILPLVKITNYGWDQSDKFVKIYITLNGIQSHPASNISTSFTSNSFELRITNFQGKDYEFSIKDLLCNVLPADSQFKQKTDMLLVMLKKEKEEKNWECLTKIEKIVKDKSKPKFDQGEDSNPQDSIMNMMKQMYEDGDDDMKRTIRKAWHESQNKKTTLDDI